jgi:hypothetical protein
MNDAFEKKVRAAAVAAWWVVLISYVLLIFIWLAFLALASARPEWMRALWGGDISWDSMKMMTLWLVGVFKLFLWSLVLGALWLTLWARQLRRYDQQAT